MPNCVDCMNFKMKKGWKYAYCSRGVLSSAKGEEDRLFTWETKTEETRNRRLKPEYQRNLLNRKIAVLRNPLQSKKPGANHFTKKVCSLFDCYK